MSAEKWLLTRGYIYQLEKASLNLNDAIRIAAKLSRTRYILLKKQGENEWAVYWRFKQRHKTGIYPCESLLEIE